MKYRVLVKETTEFAVDLEVAEDLDLLDEEEWLRTLGEAWADAYDRKEFSVHDSDVTFDIVEVLEKREGPPITVQAPKHEPEW